MLKPLFATLAALSLFAVGCATETGPSQQDGVDTVVVSAEEGEAINAKLARARCPTRCSPNEDDSYTATEAAVRWATDCDNFDPNKPNCFCP